MGHCASCCDALDDDDEVKHFNRRYRNIEQEMRTNSQEELFEQFPLHMAVLRRDEKLLKKALQQSSHSSGARSGAIDVNETDFHGYTALHLAILLVWHRGIDLLIQPGSANAAAWPLIQSESGWTAIQECIAISNKAILEKLVHSTVRNVSRISRQNVQHICQLFANCADFYVELNLELFAKGLGFVSNYFPSDVLRIYKHGTRIRVDLTLLDFDQDAMEWKRGNISYLFHLHAHNGILQFFEVDHDAKDVYANDNACLILDNNNTNVLQPNTRFTSLRKNDINDRLLGRMLSSPLISKRIVIEDALLKKSKTWMGAVKESVVDGHKCLLYQATNLRFVIKQRVSHMPEEMRKKVKLQTTDLLSLVESTKNNNADDEEDRKSEMDYEYPVWNAPNIDVEQYSSYVTENNHHNNINNNDNGESNANANANANAKADIEERFLINNCETTYSRKTYDLSIALCDDFGVELDTIVAILDLMSLRATHIEKIKDILKVTVFEDGQFPVQIEMPLFLNVVRAKITFQNMNKHQVSADVMEVPTF